MPFGTFKSIEEVAHEYQVALGVRAFVRPVPTPVDERFQEEMTFNLENLAVKASEAAVCEFLVAPVLREVWKPYRDVLTFWSHVPLGVREPLLGTPDYFFSKRSPLGLVRDKPYLVVIEAKKDDFDAGWGQCLAAMLAAQQLNAELNRVIHGCVTNGRLWNFGKLEGQSFTQEIQDYIITDLPELFAALNFVFDQARTQALAPAAA